MSDTMWWLFVFLLSAAVATEYEDESGACMERVYTECTNPDEPTEIPDTEEEFQHLCKYERTFFECARNILDNCSENKVYEETHLEFGSNILRVCEKDSLTYSALVESLPCIKTNIEDIILCPEEFREDIESYAETLAGVGITDLQTSLPEPYKCMEVLYAAGCMAAKAGKNCGDVARSVVVDFFQGFDTPYKKCPAGVKDYVADIAMAMQAEEEKRQAVENKLKRKK